MCTSVPQIAVFRILIKTSPGPGSGTGTCLSSNPTPAVGFTRASIIFFIGSSPLRYIPPLYIRRPAFCGSIVSQRQIYFNTSCVVANGKSQKTQNSPVYHQTKQAAPCLEIGFVCNTLYSKPQSANFFCCKTATRRRLKTRPRSWRPCALL